MRSIVNNIEKSYNTDKNNSVLQLQQLALDYGRFKYDSVLTDSNASKQRELLAGTLLNRYKGLKNKYQSQTQTIKANSRQMDSYLVEIYKKYSIPFACVVFVLIGAPMGMITRKGGFGVAAGMSLGFFLLYWACLIGGEKLADRELLSPFLSMWVANILLGLAGVYLVFRDSLNLKRLFKVKPI